MHYKNSKLCAAHEFLSSIANKFRSGFVISDLESKFDLKRDHLFFIQNLESSSFVSLSKLIDGKEAITVYIDERKLEDVLEATISASNTQFNEVMKTIKKHFGYEYEDEYLLVNSFVELAYQQVDHLYNPSVSLKLNLPPHIINLFYRITGIRKSVLPFVLLGKEIVKFDVDLTSLTFAFRAFKAQHEGVEAVISLIKLGADYEYVKRFNGRMDVSQSYFKAARKVFDIKIESLEKLSVLKKNEIYTQFQELLDDGLQYQDAVFKTHKLQNVTIECVTKVITRFKDEELEDLDDELEDLGNYI